MCDLCGALLASDIQQLATPHLTSGGRGSWVAGASAASVLVVCAHLLHCACLAVAAALHLWLPPSRRISLSVSNPLHPHPP